MAHFKGNTYSLKGERLPTLAISNLCSCSKIYVKLIPARINSRVAINKIDLTWKSPHGFEPKHSTQTGLQSLITSALDGNMRALMEVWILLLPLTW